VTLALVGTLPVSALNLGLQASTTGLQAKITKLTADISGLTAAVDTQVEVQASFPPSAAGFAAGFASALDVAAMTVAFDPSTWATANVDGNAALLVELGLVDAQIAILDPIVADITAGISAPGIYGWTYAGFAGGFGPALSIASAFGYGGIGATEAVSALVIATELFASWEAFSEGFETGDSAQVNLGETPSQARLRALGGLSGGEWNTGTRAVLNGLRLTLEALRGAKAGIESQIDVSVGLNLPSPAAQVDFGLGLDLDAALDNLLTVSADLTGAIAGIQAEIDATATLSASIATQLSAGGLSFWSYSGAAAGIGGELETALAGGLPGTSSGPRGACYGVVLVSKSPSVWADFGRVFKTS
jgi:hypothetical protein